MTWARKEICMPRPRRKGPSAFSCCRAVPEFSLDTDLFRLSSRKCRHFFGANNLAIIPYEQFFYTLFLFKSNYYATTKLYFFISSKKKADPFGSALKSDATSISLWSHGMQYTLRNRQLPASGSSLRSHQLHKPGCARHGMLRTRSCLRTSASRCQ